MDLFLIIYCLNYDHFIKFSLNRGCILIENQINMKKIDDIIYKNNKILENKLIFY